MDSNGTEYVEGLIAMEEDYLIKDTMEGSTASYNNISAGPIASNDTSGVHAVPMVVRFVVEVIIVMPIAILGVMGNVLAFIVLWRQKNRLTTTVLLQALAVIDSLILIMAVMLRSLRYIHHHNEQLLTSYMAAYPVIFRWMYPTVYFLRLTGTWLTVLLTIDRYIAVCLPLHAQRICTLTRTFKHVVLLVISALLFSLPRYFEYVYSDNAYGFVLRKRLMDNQSYVVGYRLVLFLVCMYVLPLVVCVTLNLCLLRAQKRADTHRISLQPLKTSSRHQRSITAIVVVVVAVCIVCNIVAMVTHLFWSLEECFPTLSHLQKPRRFMSQVNNIMVTINSAINFLIYCLCSRNFRFVFWNTFHCHRPELNRPKKPSWSAHMSVSTYIAMVQQSSGKKVSTSTP